MPSKSISGLKDAWEVVPASPSLVIGRTPHGVESLAFAPSATPTWTSRLSVFDAINGRPPDLAPTVTKVYAISSLEAYEGTSEIGSLLVLCRKGEILLRVDLRNNAASVWSLFKELGLRVLDFAELYKDTAILLGKGSFSTCHKYLCRRSESFRAVKVTRYGAVDRKAAAPMTEVEVLRHFSHPYLVRFYDSFVRNEQILVVMEHLEGDMWRFAERNRGIDPGALAVVMHRMLEALEALHAWGAVHRDVKPENIMMREPNEPRSAVLIDLGLCLLSETGQGRHRCGSPGYCAPEIINSRLYDCKVDVYSLGVTCWALATGRSPFKRANVSETLKANQRSELDFSLPVFDRNPNLTSFITHLTHKDAWRRYSVADALKHPFLSKQPTPQAARQRNHRC